MILFHVPRQRAALIRITDILMGVMTLPALAYFALIVIVASEAPLCQAPQAADGLLRAECWFVGMTFLTALAGTPVLFCVMVPAALIGRWLGVIGPVPALTFGTAAGALLSFGSNHFALLGLIASAVFWLVVRLRRPEAFAVA